MWKVKTVSVSWGCNGFYLSFMNAIEGTKGKGTCKFLLFSASNRILKNIFNCIMVH